MQISERGESPAACAQQHTNASASNDVGGIQYLTNANWNDSRLGLERLQELLTRLGNPHEQLRYIHVAGTNGKGSICAMSSQILRQAGYKTGLFTSPYINRFHEQIQIDGVPISDDALSDITRRIRKEAECMADHPTEFELITAVAFLCFFEAQCDIVVLEVGLGGRLDATNVIVRPEVAVIAPISMDHVQELGDSIEKIAAEKAGIIKQGCSVISSVQLSEAADVLKQVSAARNAPIAFLDAQDVLLESNTLDGLQFTYQGFAHLEVHLLGAFQAQNASVVLMTMQELIKKGWSITTEAIRQGLRLARWPARFEILHERPWVIVDGGHNLQCMQGLAQSLGTYFPGKKIVFVLGVMADKDYRAMFQVILPFAKRVFAITPDNPRALPARELADYFRSMGVEAAACDSLVEGIQEAMKAETEEGVICATGSLYFTGAVRELFVAL